MTTTETIPELTLPWRMKLALDHAHLTVGAMADYLGVDRNTVGNWINGRITPKTQSLRLWSMRCGVPYEWLVTGATSSGLANEPTVTKAPAGTTWALTA